VSYRFPWYRLSDEHLLDLRICDLALKIKGSFLEPHIKRLYSELNDRGIRFKPHVWLSEESRCAFVRVIRNYKPKLILTPQWDDPHPDHSNTARIVREAARLASMRRYDEENGQEAVRVPAVAHSVFSRLVPPSFVVDVSDFLEGKMKAIKAHASQFFRPGSDEPVTRISDPGFLTMMEARTRYYGSLIGVEAGEAFYVREALNIDDPVSLLTRPMNIYS